MEGEIKIEGDIDLPIGDQGGPELREVVVEGRELRVLLLEHIGDGPIAKLGSLHVLVDVGPNDIPELNGHGDEFLKGRLMREGERGGLLDHEVRDGPIHP